MSHPTKEQLEALSAATNGEVYDHEWNGGQWMSGAVETHETIEQFVESSNKWAECSKDQFGEIAGFKFVAWNNMQVAKGHQRDSLSVIDFGDVRVALQGVDLTNFI